jgi:cytochrome c556
MKAVAAAVLGSLALALAIPAQAQPKPEDVIKFRKGVFQVVFWHFRPMNAMVKGDMPFDQAAFTRNAQLVAAMATVAPDAFPAGTDKGDTRARPEIWSDPAGFRKVMESFQAETAKLEQVARGATSVDQVRAQFGAAARSCSACHDNYRAK